MYKFRSKDRLFVLFLHHKDKLFLRSTKRLNFYFKWVYNIFFFLFIYFISIKFFFKRVSSIFQDYSIKNFPLFCHLSHPPTDTCLATSAPCCRRHCLMDSVTNAFADRRRRRCRCRRRCRRLTDHYKCSLSRGRDMTEPSERESTKANSRKKDIQRKFRIVCRLLQVAVCQFFFGVVVDYFYKSH